MKILLDENLPRKLVAALRAKGCEAESVPTPRMQAMDNGKVYQFAIQNFDVCFMRDFGFSNIVRQTETTAKFKLLRVTISAKITG